VTTTNKGLTQPTHGSTSPTWDIPLNGNFGLIDTALGGNIGINLTGLSGNIVLTSTQYTPPNIILTGTPTAAVTLYFPAGVGWLGSVFNDVTAFAVNLACDTTGESIAPLPPSVRSLVVSDGTNVQFADTNSLVAAQAYANALLAGTSGTFTAAGIGGLPNATMTYLIVGKFCTLSLLSTGMIGTISGGLQGFGALPAPCRPANANTKYIPCFVTNNGVANLLGQAQVSNSAQVALAFATSNANGIVFGGFTSGRSGGLAAGWTITYPLL
jgi:hypothetical protein